MSKKAVIEPGGDTPEPTFDFKELADGNQKGEKLELMVREILLALGFDASWTGRGPDDGLDIFAVETIESPISRTKRSWVVSCKHYAHAGRSVNEADVGSITDKCQQHKADGFLLVTTTVPSSGLTAAMKGLTLVEADCWDNSRLAAILSRPEMDEILKRYMPKSYARLKKNQPRDILIANLKDAGVNEVGLARVAAVIREVMDGPPKVVPSAENIYPKSKQVSLIDAAVAAFAVRENVEETATTMAGLDQGEWLSTIDVLKNINDDLAKDVLKRVASTDPSKSKRLDAVQMILDEYNNDLSDVAEFLDGLEMQDAETILDQFEIQSRVQDKLQDHLSENGNAEIDSLGQYTANIDVSVQSFDYSFFDGKIYVDGEFNLGCDVCGGGGEGNDGVAFPCSFPGTYSIEYDPDDLSVEIKDVKIDNSSFYEGQDDIDMDEHAKLPIPGDF